MLADWEESVEWIAKGWDCLDEYVNDLSAREALDIGLARYRTQSRFAEDIIQKVEAIDEKFRSATVPSNLCVQHCGTQYRAYPNGAVELIFEPYDRDKFWYYYRWQPDSPYPWRKLDGITYQKNVYGLDFENMSESQLKEVIREKVVRAWDNKG